MVVLLEPAVGDSRGGRGRGLDGGLGRDGVGLGLGRDRLDGAGWMDCAGGTDGVACGGGDAGVGGTATAWRAIAAATPGSGLFATGPSDGTGGRSDAGGAWWTGRPPGACECAW